MSKRDQWRKTVEEQLPIRDHERQSIRKIMSRMRGKPAEAEVEKDQTDLPDLISSDQTPVQELDRSSLKTGTDDRPVKADTVSESRPAVKSRPVSDTRPVQKLDRSSIKQGAGYLRVPNEIFDEVLPKLSPTEGVVFLRLYRLSVGFNSNRCTVGNSALMKACNISEQTCRVALRRLIDLQHVKVVEVINTKTVKGTTYEILTGLENIPVKNLDRYEKETGLIDGPNKDHDHDDLQNTDPHQAETMKIYQSLTGNAWTKTDLKAYQQIRHVPSAAIETTIRAVLDRAKDQPRSLNYFVGEILGAGKSKPVGTAARRQLEQIINKVRELHVGGDSEGLRQHVERECHRKGISFDWDLFKEIISSQ